MKIKKLTEAIKLVEADDEPILSEIDPQDTPISEIADAIQTSVETSTDGVGDKEVSDAAAIKQAIEIKATADEVNAGAAEIIPTKEDSDNIVINNRLTELLDRALTQSKKFMRRGSGKGTNILIEGLPGSGKTAIVESWARSRGIKLVTINATDPKLETAVNGMPLRDVTKPDKNVVTIANSDLLDDLSDPKYAGNCVLFVDEFNRQLNQQLRRVFLSIFNEKRNASGTLDFSKNLLFTVVCINPAGAQYHDKGTDKLNQAERTRFLYDITDFDSSTAESLAYYDGNFVSNLLKLGVIVPESKAAKHYNTYGPIRKLTDEALSDIDDELRVHDLASYILKDEYHPQTDFSFDTRDDLADINDYGKQLLNSRKLTDMLYNADGKKADFLEIVDKTSNLLDKDKQMFHDIFDIYILDLPSLRKQVGIGLTKEEREKEAAEAKNSTAADEIVDTDIEDDDDFFEKAANGKTAPTPSDVEQTINDFINKL